MNQLSFLENNDNIEQPISLNLIDNTNQQRDFCYALSFNNDNTILITNSENLILIWKFEFGKMELIQSVSGHTEDVNCLIFSKKTNNFISGSNDNCIRCWKQVSSKEWVSSQEFERNSYIYTLKLNNKENQLISGSFHGQINVWNLDFDSGENELKLIQSLDKHTSTVYDLSLNQSETQFISCSKDNTIIVWGLGLNNYWEFKYIVKQSIDDFGCKVHFINDDQFIWVSGGQESQDCIYTFGLNKGVFEEIPEAKVQLIKDITNFDIFQFPIIYQEQQNIMIIRHKTHIYVIQRQLNGKFKICYQLNYQTNVIFGTLTNDSKYLVVKSNTNNKYMIYEVILN
ncbi:unnamed protein product (macronuclear) [Paramecium tetraurelia]|uniref:Uncharacterized protein n=1 Tax=Paramecium tetraurelia TaxID=5888 RepID=A0DKM6_PARTE|nr:uncharacterized protein GSPATT00017923001 [Paramecium tetraurelia]CAK83593.1 unnamed protein product [Paramecium tetraurelia]|eukprot:XP_001450990.1 hypothetical protein (macronuclear) [Paramecium tetraurelia strain d4-2]